MKKLIFCAALFAAITFAACSDDDESNLPATEANIVGTWQIVHVEGYWENPRYGDKETWSEDYPDVDDEGWEYWTYTFDERGTGTYTEYYNGESSGSWKFSYSISGKILTISDEDEGGIDRFRIDKLTKSQLVLFARSSYDYGDWEEETTTYKRIK